MMPLLVQGRVQVALQRLLLEARWEAKRKSDFETS